MIKILSVFHLHPTVNVTIFRFTIAFGTHYHMKWPLFVSLRIQALFNFQLDFETRHTKPTISLPVNSNNCHRWCCTVISYYHACTYFVVCTELLPILQSPGMLHTSPSKQCNALVWLTFPNRVVCKSGWVDGVDRSNLHVRPKHAVFCGTEE